MATTVTPAPLTRTLAAVAADIRADYASKGRPVHYAAVPYVDALATMHTASMAATFGHDDAVDIVTRLLGNLTTWRGATATAVRGELRAALAHAAAERTTRRA